MKNNNPVGVQSHTPPLENVCTCEECYRDPSSDFLKIRCICFKENNHLTDS